MIKNKKAAMHLFAALAVIFWALGYIMTRVAIRHFSAEALSFLRPSRHSPWQPAQSREQPT